MDVLIVDDDAAIRTLVCLLLEEEGYAVSSAENGIEALQAVRAEMPRAVLLDLNMPVMSGWECYANLQELAPDLPVIFMTAADAAGEARRHHAAGHLAKPFSIDALLAVVQTALAA